MEENRAAFNRIVKLEAELQETVARRGEMFVEGQDSIKKEVVKKFPSKNFTWIDDIFLEEGDEGEQEEEGQAKENPTSRVSVDNVIDIENNDVVETREKGFEDLPAM